MNQPSIEYDASFWDASIKPRQATMPALGPLLVADYRKFLQSDHLDEMTAPKKLAENIPPESPSVRYSRYGIDIEFDGPELGVLYSLVSAATQAKKAAEIYSADNSFEPTLTTAQREWLQSNTFHGGFNLPMFHVSNLVSGVNALTYFTTAKIGYRKFNAVPTGSSETIIEEISSAGFVNGLRNAAGATLSFWQIPDHILIHYPQSSPLYLAHRLAENASEINDFEEDFFDSDGNLDAKIVEFIKNNKKRSAESITNGDTSSGCPIKHTSLGPNMQAALTPEQWKTVEDVAEIDDHEIIRYTWDPFRATVDYFVPRIREALAINRSPIKPSTTY
jgi:hypothetical protein